MNRNVKSVLSFIIIFSLLLTGYTSMVSAASTAENTGEKAALLSYLGVTEQGLQLQGTLSRKDAVKYAVLLKRYTLAAPEGIFHDVPADDTYAAYIETVCHNGLISMNQEKTFRPDDSIMPLELIKILVHVCGYGTYLEYNQGLVYADSLGLLKGTGEISIHEPVSMENAIVILANALELDLMIQTSVNADGTGRFQVVKGKNILSEIYHIKKVKGVVTANEKGSIYSEKDGVSGLSIDGTVYRCKREYQAYLGYFVSAYVDTESEEIVFLTPAAKNRVLKLRSDDIQAESTKSNLVYYDKDDRNLNAKIKSDGSYFINDVYFANLESGLVRDEDFRREHSVFVLIDNDGNGTYDLVFEEQYRYFQVKTVRSDEMVIQDKLSGAEIEVIDSDVFRYGDGVTLSLEELQYNDILGVKVPENFNFSGRSEGIDFLVLQDVVKGKAYVNSPQYVTVDGTSYRLNGITADSVANKEASFYLDANGRIVAVDTTNINGGARYLYIVNIDKPDGVLGSVKAKTLDSQEGLCIKEIDEKVSVYQGHEKVFSGSEKLLEEKTTVLKKLLKVSYSAEGRIKRLELPSELAYGTSGDKGDFNRIAANTYRKRGEDVFNDLYRIPANAVAFVVPVSENDDEIYSVKTVKGISMYEDIELELYNVDNEFQVGCILVKQKDASSGPVGAEGSLFVVEKIAQSILEDGTLTLKAYGLYNGEYKGFQFLEENAKAKSFDDTTDVYGAVKRRMTAKDLACGDILLLNLDGTTINSFRVLLDQSEDPDFARQGSDDWDDVADWPIDYAFVSKAMILTNGTINAKDGNVVSYEMDIPSKGLYTKNSFISSAQNIYLVDMERNKVSKITSGSMEIKPGRRVFTTMVWGRERDLVVYK